MKYNICSDFNCNLKSIAVKVGWNFVLISSLSHSWLKIQQNFILFLQSFNQLFGLYSYISAYCAEEIIQLEIIATIPLSIRGHVSSKHCFVQSSYPMYGPLCLPCAAFQSGSILRGDLVRQVLHSRLGNFFWVVLNWPFNVLSPMCPHSFMIRQVERLEPSGVPSGHHLFVGLVWPPSPKAYLIYLANSLTFPNTEKCFVINWVMTQQICQ